MIEDLPRIKTASSGRGISSARGEYARDPVTFAADLSRQDAALLYIQRACEAALDMGQRLISHERLGAPQSARKVLMIVPTLPRGHVTRPLPRLDTRRPEFVHPRWSARRYTQVQSPSRFSRGSTWMSSASWAEEEMRTADLGDERLNARAAKVLEQLGAHPRNSIPTACRSWAETMAAYRFFDNEKATFETVLAPHRDATLQRMECCPVLLLAQDTTELDKWVNLGPKGVGTIKEQRKHPRRLHPTVAFTPERVCLGVVAAEWWQRDEPSPRKERRGKGVDEKESRRWIDSYQRSCALQGQLPQSQVVNLADAEGDLYEWFVEHEDVAATTRAQWIVRAAQDRRVLDGAADKLWASVAATPSLGQIKVEVRARPKRPARLAQVTLRSASLTLQPPARVGHRLPEVLVNAVLAREEHPPEGVEPLEWLLLTSLPVGSLAQTATVVEWYAVRWCIEVYFHVLKNGCQINRLQLETEERLLPCIGLYLVVTWRVLYSLMLGRSCPDLSCELVFEAREWQAAYMVAKRCMPPQTPPSLGEVVMLIASLGGYLGRKHDGPPGPKAMWTGLQRLRDFVIAFEARDALTGTCV